MEYQHPRIKEAIVRAGFNEDDFSQWVNDHKIHPLWTVRRIPNILENPRSKEVFLTHGRGSAREALKLLDKPSGDKVLKDTSMIQLARELLERILALPYGEVQRLKSDSSSDEVFTFLEVRDQLIELCRDIRNEE
ncbi:hypothetical protein FP828_07980 [bacterium]|nr:hypothetical protein [bacterium]